MEIQLYFFWSSISLIAFYLFYLLLLKRETFFLLNRIYLLAALCLSLVIPLLHFFTFIKLPKIELMVSTLAVIGGNEKLAILTEKELNWLPIIYWTGVMCTAVLLLVKLFGVRRQIKLAEKGSAFSFWNTKVIDKALDNFVAIDAHEDVHVKQFHTLDVLLIEVISVFFWFNPIIYGYRNSLKFIHEYLADEHAANFAGSKKQYAMVLFLQNFKAGPVLTNTFYHPSLLEARIKMLQQKKSNGYRLWKYTLCVPLIVVMMVMCAFSASVFNKDSTNEIVQAATFPGGSSAFASYLIKTARNVSTKKGRVELSFIVETDGEITNEKIEKSLDEASDQEALRLIKLSPKWESASQKGQKVRSGYQIGINFQPGNQ